MNEVPAYGSAIIYYWGRLYIFLELHGECLWQRAAKLRDSSPRSAVMGLEQGGVLSQCTAQGLASGVSSEGARTYLPYK